MSLSRGKALPVLSALVFLLIGCGGGSTSAPPPPPSITFTSTPNTSAEEGVQYSYLLAATSSDSGAITFSLTTAPSGATLSGNTINWTPAHAESRTSNSFTVTATSAAGGSARQSWTVTPNGTVNITALITYWSSSGSTNVAPQWLANLPYPAALVPQTDGSLQRLQGAANPDGSFSIPNVPAGYYWLQINPNANYWTSTSDFDYGQDVIGQLLSISSQTSTTFSFSVSGLEPSSQVGNLFYPQSDFRGFFLPDFSIQPNSTTFNGAIAVNSNIDWSKISTLYLSEYLRGTFGNFTGYILGPTQTLSGLSFVNGGTNPVVGMLSPSTPPASLALSITGSAWAPLTSAAGPGNPTPAYSDYAAFVQPFVTDRLAVPLSPLLLGPDFTLLRPAALTVNPLPFPSSYGCESSGGPLNTVSPPNLGVAPITTDVDYGVLSYNDPYPSNWPRLFEYCQVSAFSFPRPNSTVTDTFYVTNKQTTTLPAAAVTPILSSVQSPTLNGSSLFQSATLNSTNMTISWTPPSMGQPYGYFVEVYQLGTLPTGSTGYATAGIYATTKTSLTVPFISPSSTYVFAILSASDAKANIESSPLRHKFPFAESGVVSAPFVIQ
jgi:hypothetical protein